MDEQRQQEIGEKSPSWVHRRLDEETTPPDHAELDTYREELPYTEPMWTQANGWRKWHAERDCGTQCVYIIENPLAESNSREEYAWTLYCGSCGSINWDEILFLHRDWYVEQFDKNHIEWRMLEPFNQVWLKPEWVCELGGVPSDDEDVRRLIRRSWYESEAIRRMADL